MSFNKKSIITIIILVLSGSVMGQKNLSVSPKNDVSEIIGSIEFLNLFADSLNLISSPDQLPKILSDYLLDWKLGNRFSNHMIRANFSFRKSLIDRVTREDVLEWIVKSKNPCYDSLYDPEKLKAVQKPTNTLIYHPEEFIFCELPFMKRSTRDLTKLRLSKLRSRRQQIDR
jgi:hypothetical protein